jgi:hypothetical protein
MFIVLFVKQLANNEISIHVDRFMHYKVIYSCLATKPETDKLEETSAEGKGF